MRNLPSVLNGQKRARSTGSPFGAAWGRPAIRLRCGVAEPATFVSEVKLQTGPPCLTVNGVDWYLQGEDPPSFAETSSSQTLTVTTVFRKPAIELVIPERYGTQGPSTAMALLTDVIKRYTTLSERCL